jgi:hypothetical protein
MRTRLFAVAMTICIPAISFAQKGGGSKAGPEGAPASPSSSAGSMAVKAPSSRDLADLSPAALLVDKKKKASLADSTVNQLKALAKQFDERNKPFYAAYDSTRKWTLPISDNSSTRKMKDLTATAQQQMQSGATAEQEKMQSSMRDLRIMMTEFKVRRMANSEEALRLIPEAQKKAAGDLLTQQDADLDKLIGAGRP